MRLRRYAGRDRTRGRTTRRTVARDPSGPAGDMVALRDLFRRSLVDGLLVFAVLDLSSAKGEPNALLLCAALVLPVAGMALVQGALVNAVDDDRHRRATRSACVLLGDVRPRFGALLGVSVLTGLGLSLLVVVVPGLVLFPRWSVSVPVVLLEG